jgi:hypothetical protein
MTAVGAASGSGFGGGDAGDTVSAYLQLTRGETLFVEVGGADGAEGTAGFDRGGAGGSAEVNGEPRGGGGGDSGG